MGIKNLLGKKVKRLRKMRGYTQEKFAEMIGIDPKNVSRIENGNNYPSADTLTAIAKALNVDIYELFVFKEDVPYEKMRQEILKAMENDKTVLYLFQMLKAM